MTIKDIANRVSCFRLVYQRCVQSFDDMNAFQTIGLSSLEVGVQAVAMYLKTRETRCDLQDDYPLLLGRTLSGTLADDDRVNHRIWLMAANVIQYRTSIYLAPSSTVPPVRTTCYMPTPTLAQIATLAQNNTNTNCNTDIDGG